MIKVSVITVVLNGENTIERTIQSVIGQVYPYVEYVVIDGGSTDGTVDIIRKYENHISHWVSEPDNGIYDAMNKGLKHINGDIVNFLNAGDRYYNDNVLANICMHFNDESDTDILIGREMIEGKPCRTYLEGNCRSVYFDAFFPHQATFSKTRLYEDHGFDENYRICADYDWILNAYYKGYKFKWCDDIVAVYDPDGISSSTKSIAEQYLISKKYLQLTCETKLMETADSYYRNRFGRDFFRNLIKKHVTDGIIRKCLSDVLDGRVVDIWGAGNIGRHVNGFLKANGVNVRYMLDSDVSKQGTISDGTPICGFDMSDKNYIIISTEDHEGEVAKLLDREGLAEGEDYMTYTGFSLAVTQYLMRQGYDDGGFAEMTGLRYE